MDTLIEKGLGKRQLGATPKTEEGQAVIGGLFVTRLSAAAQQQRKLEPRTGDGTLNNPYQYDVAIGDPIPESLLVKLQNEATFEQKRCVEQQRPPAVALG